MRCVLTACLFALMLVASTACGHADSEPPGSMSVGEEETRTIASGEGLEVDPGTAYRLTFSPVASIEERSGSCSGEITYREIDVTSHKIVGEDTACVVVYCASGCSSVEVQVEHLSQ